MKKGWKLATITLQGKTSEESLEGHFQGGGRQNHPVERK